MDPFNPYAPPRTEDLGTGPLRSGAGGWRLDDRTLIVGKGVRLPDVCIATGQPAQERVRRTLYWAPPWVMAMLALSWLIGLIIYFIVRKSGAVDYAFSPAARSRRNSSILIGVVGTLLCIGLLIAGISNEQAALIIAAFVLMLVAILFGVLRGRAFQLMKIDEESLHLRLNVPAAEAFSRLQAGYR